MSFIKRLLMPDGKLSPFGFAIGLVETVGPFQITLLSGCRMFCVKWTEGSKVNRLLFRSPTSARIWAENQVKKGELRHV